MALVMMAMLFMLSEMLRMKKQCPLLTKLRGYRDAASSFPSATGREPRAGA
jgi:hypothetical protein